MNLQSFSLIIIACLVFSCSTTETKTQETVAIDTTKVEQKTIEETEKFFSTPDEAANQVFLALKANDFSLIKSYFANGNQQEEIINNIDEDALKQIAKSQANEEYSEEQIMENLKKQIISEGSKDLSTGGQDDFNLVSKNLKENGVDLTKATLESAKYELEKLNGFKNIEHYAIICNLNYGGVNYKVSLGARRFSKGLKMGYIIYVKN
jgi:hypothetical protein